MVELNPFLQPVGSPITSTTKISGYQFASTNERSVITNSFLQDLAVTSAKIVDLEADKIAAGTISVQLGVGNGKVIIDGENNRIMVYDDSGTARILIGYQLNGF